VFLGPVIPPFQMFCTLKGFKTVYFYSLSKPALSSLK
jgi:hypothetical protein